MRAALPYTAAYSVGWLYPSGHNKLVLNLPLTQHSWPSEVTGLMYEASSDRHLCAVSLCRLKADSKEWCLWLWREPEVHLSWLCLWRIPLYLLFSLTPSLAWLPSLEASLFWHLFWETYHSAVHCPSSCLMACSVSFIQKQNTTYNAGGLWFGFDVVFLTLLTRAVMHLKCD